MKFNQTTSPRQIKKLSQRIHRPLLGGLVIVCLAAGITLGRETRTPHSFPSSAGKSARLRITYCAAAPGSAEDSVWIRAGRII